jgi:hypothetical protein
MYDGVAMGLEAKKIIYRSSNISAPGGTFPYNMQPYARKILNENPRRPDGRGSGQFAESALDTLYVARNRG